MNMDKKELSIIATSFAFVAISYLVNNQTNKTIILAIALIIAGHEIILKAYKSLKNKLSLDENFLMSIASIAAFSIGEMVEAVAILLFYRVGEAFENYSVKRSRKSVSQLMDLAPNYANVKREDKVIKVNPSEVKIGETILIKPGEKVPIDGVITSGETMLNTASINGEPVPLEVGVGDKIVSGYINLNALIEVKTTKDYENSTATQILEMVENATFKKSKSERFITKFARIYTPIVVGFAFCLAFVAPFLFNGDFSQWLERAIIFLVVSCPCALVVSVPLSFFGGIGGASKNGILIKGSNYIEALSKVKSIAFDKTGTISKGELVIDEIVALNGHDKNEILSFAALAEKNSIHPIALSLNKAYKNDKKAKISNVIESAGLGVSAVINEHKIKVGSAKFLQEFNPQNIDKTAIHVAINDKYAGYITLKDELRSESRECIKWLTNAGITTALITGDKKNTALQVGKSIGIDRVHYELLPNEKVSTLEAIMDKTDGTTAYVGDGINDAPVIARADVGIAMLGSDAAIQTADIVLMHNNLAKLTTAIKIAKKTIAIAKFNIAFSIGFKLGVLILAIFGYANIPLAIFADVGVTIIAILNAFRAFKI